MADGSITIDTRVDNSGIKDGLSKIGNIAKTGLKAVTAVTGVASVAVTALTKSSIDAYAEYEQLAGGVETLFKKSSDKVKGYADKAYKTAGLSANEYMSTVTSFSASLLQSLNGDTAKSADIADMAIRDMSDNANKMGTDMALIQTAYQGFAKQNYTMLDNLKLGYGGTKTEMERLLSDAEKLSGQKYDISNLNDVYNAIHVVQNKLGITGTTAKEASTTIQGSIASMKASWSNLLAGMGKDQVDFEGIISEFVDSLGTVFENVIPRIKVVLKGMVELIQEIVPMIVEVLSSLAEQLLPSIIASITSMFQAIVNVLPELLTVLTQLVPDIVNMIIEALPLIVTAGIQILTALMQGILSSLPTMLPTLLACINNIVSILVDNLPLILNMGIQILLALIQGIAKALPDLMPTIVECVLKIVDVILDNIDMIIDVGIEVLLALIDGIIEALPKIAERLPEIVIKIVATIIKNLPKLILAGIEIIGAIIKGIFSAVGQLMYKCMQLVSDYIIKPIAKKISGIFEVGKNLVKGIWNGISDATSWLWGKISGFCSGILDKIKGFFGIHSPSTVFRDEIGQNLAFGLGEGFEEGLDEVYKDMQKAVNIETGRMSANVLTSGTYQSSLNTKDLNANITINNRMDIDSEPVARQTNKVNQKLNLQYSF